MSLLSVKNLSKTFQSGWWPVQPIKEHAVLHDTSFDVQSGANVALLGTNGAGKTTLISMLLGVLSPTSGAISYFGQPFMYDQQQALQKIGYANGYDRLPARLTVFENLDWVGRIYGMSRSHRAQQIEKFLKLFDIWNLKDRQTGTLSAGQATRVMLIKAFFANPILVLLDEPTASLDPSIAEHVRQFILEQRQQEEVSILITSHNMDEVTQLCDRVLMLHQGNIIANNTPHELAESVGRLKLSMTIENKIDQVIMYLQQHALVYVHEGQKLIIECDEDGMRALLVFLSREHIAFSHLFMNQPSLQDYFLHIARK